MKQNSYFISHLRNPLLFFQDKNGKILIPCPFSFTGASIKKWLERAECQPLKATISWPPQWQWELSGSQHWPLSVGVSGEEMCPLNSMHVFSALPLILLFSCFSITSFMSDSYALYHCFSSVLGFSWEPSQWFLSTCTFPGRFLHLFALPAFQVSESNNSN